MLEIFGRAFSLLRFPNRAGTYQDAEDLDALVAELGGNYEQYHVFLAEVLEREAPDIPNPVEHQDSLSELLRQVGWRQEVFFAETLLRASRLAVSEDLTLEDAFRQDLGTLVAADGLVSALAPQAVTWDPPRPIGAGPEAVLPESVQPAAADLAAPNDLASGF